MSIQKLKETVKEFLEAEYSEGDYGSITRAMFKSDYPKEDSKWNGEFVLKDDLNVEELTRLESSN